MAYIYKITYPNGKIYIGAYWHRKASKSYTKRDGMFTYFGSPVQHEKISQDLQSCRMHFAIIKEVLYECDDPETVEQEKEILKIERDMIRKFEANNPSIGIT
jgi:hypothetical protein